MAAERTGEQGELWPSVTDTDKLKTRRMLEDYMKNKQMVMAFSQKNTLPDQMKKVYQEKKDELEIIELAFNLIQDPAVKKIIENRFFKLRKWKETVNYHSGGYSERTVDRYIDKGIEAVADSLKLWGFI
ncbi:hypothetical protein [Paenibacillus chibensis]|uniref:hypothetical protein n=1 Tax=Paenibacillus chibensis TaxID=59846 RepID=UPI000FD9BF77|nr:hypothetical protein [Paenibacillus chibensis]MEC0370868.1 hypothetical protein [Paenibacillus chibensis]